MGDGDGGMGVGGTAGGVIVRVCVAAGGGGMVCGGGVCDRGGCDGGACVCDRGWGTTAEMVCVPTGLLGGLCSCK